MTRVFGSLRRRQGSLVLALVQVMALLLRANWIAERGTDSVAGYLRSLPPSTLAGRGSQVRSPTRRRIHNATI
jgi:hypothetical protein